VLSIGIHRSKVALKTLFRLAPLYPNKSKMPEVYELRQGYSTVSAELLFNYQPWAKPFIDAVRFVNKQAITHTMAKLSKNPNRLQN
jgi:hypothetical protein